MAAFADGSVTVLAPALEAELDAGRRGRWHAASHVDVVSGATRAIKSDIVSGATRFSERRTDLAVSWRSPTAERELGAEVAASQEFDFASVAARVSAKFEAAERRSSIVVGLGGSLERLWLPGEAPAWRPLGSVALDVDGAHVLNPRLVLQTAASVRHHRCDATVGCAASPYRAVALLWRDGDRTSVRERHPASRWRTGGRVGLSYTPIPGVGVHAGVEPSWDDWGVAGGAVVAAASWDDGLGGRRLRLTARASTLTAARFFRRVDATEGADGAETAPRFRTADRRLAGVDCAEVEAEAAWPLPWRPAGTRLGLLLHAGWIGTNWRGIGNALGGRAVQGGVAIEVGR